MTNCIPHSKNLLASVCHLHINILPVNVWVKYFERNCKCDLYDSTQNILPIHWKMFTLYRGKLSRALRLRFVSWYVLLNCSPEYLPQQHFWRHPAHELQGYCTEGQSSPQCGSYNREDTEGVEIKSRTASSEKYAAMPSTSEPDLTTDKDYMRSGP